MRGFARAIPPLLYPFRNLSNTRFSNAEMLSDLIIAALNEANRKAEDAMSKVMEGLQGGLPGLNLPF